MSQLEIAADAVTTLSIWLAARNSLHTWWTAIMGALLFVLLFHHEARLCADVTLQGIFALTSLIEWTRWRQGADGTSLPVSRASPRLILAAVGGGLVAAAG